MAMGASRGHMIYWSGMRFVVGEVNAVRDRYGRAAVTGMGGGGGGRSLTNGLEFMNRP